MAKWPILSHQYQMNADEEQAMNNSQTTSRRSFIKLAAASTVAASTSHHILAAELGRQDKPIAANEKIRIATIGIGGRATDITQTALRVPGVELVAVAD